MPAKKTNPKKGFYTIVTRKDGYAEYRTSPEKEGIEKAGDMIGKFHTHAAGWKDIEKRWQEDAKKKGLTKA